MATVSDTSSAPVSGDEPSDAAAGEGGDGGNEAVSGRAGECCVCECALEANTERNELVLERECSGRTGEVRGSESEESAVEEEEEDWEATSVSVSDEEELSPSD